MSTPGVVVCEQCGARNQPGDRFCVSCKAYLSWDETTATRRPGAPADPAGRPGGGAPGGPQRGGGPPERKPGVAAPDPGPADAGVRLELSRTPPPVLPLGGQHELTATVRNTGTLVDEVVLGVEPRVGWIRVEPSRLSLFPGREEQVTVLLAPPTVPAPPAGPLRYRVIARSALHPRVSATADASVTVGAVDALAAYLEPVSVEAKTRAAARVVLRNDGNRPMPITVFRADAEPGVRTDLVPGRLELWPGRTAEVAVRLRPARRFWRGEPQRHAYRLRVQPHLGRPVDLDATLVQRPLFARWLLPAVVALILAPLLAVGGVVLARVLTDLSSGPARTNPPAVTEPARTSQQQTGGGQQTTEPPPVTTEAPTTEPPATTTEPPATTPGPSP